MVEDFFPGEIAIVDPELQPKPGDYVVAKLDKDDKVVFRKYRLRGPSDTGHSAIELAPLNENYPTAVKTEHRTRCARYENCGSVHRGLVG